MQATCRRVCFVFFFLCMLAIVRLRMFGIPNKTQRSSSLSSKPIHELIALTAKNYDYVTIHKHEFLCLCWCLCLNVVHVVVVWCRLLGVPQTKRSTAAQWHITLIVNSVLSHKDDDRRNTLSYHQATHKTGGLKLCR